MYIFAACLFGFSLFMLVTGVPLISLILFGIGIVLTAVGLAKRFWKQTRIRLVELLVMTSLAGVVLGLSCQAILTSVRNDDAILYIPLVFCCVVIWILGGVSNAVIVAERLKRDGTFQRLFLIGIYLLLPLVVVFTPILFCVVCSQITYNPTTALFGFLALAIAPVWFCIYAWDLRTRAKLAGELGVGSNQK